jgi:hypothetical protein
VLQLACSLQSDKTTNAYFLKREKEMNPENLLQEKKKIEEKLKQLRIKMVQSIEKGNLFGLDRKIRQVQQNFKLLGRI